MTCLLSFDVEDWFHAHNLTPAIGRGNWDDCESRVEENTVRILELLDKHDTTATFFVLGWVAERHPELVLEIDRQGHEIASHGYNHELVYEQTRAEFQADVERSLDVLRELTDREIRGYRAPSFSITDWATDVLAELGFDYDSSSFAVTGHDRYGRLSVGGDGTFSRLPNGLVEARLPQMDMARLSLPWGGGGYFRVIPYPIFRRGVERISAGRPYIFYLHPWDLDPDQPRRPGLPLTYRFRHYTNLGKTADRLDRLLTDLEWRPIESRLPVD